MASQGFSVNDYIFDADRTNFTRLVLENSRLGPVLVHFWSPKAGPSFRLYPLLEKLVGTYQGSFLLVNIDVDEQRSVAHDYAITSIPTLKLFVDGEVMETQFGYQNEQDLRFMLDQYVASEIDRIIHDALQLFDQGETENAYQTLGKAALDNPHYYKLPLTIATLMRGEDRFDEALNLLKALPDSIRQKKGCESLMTNLEFSSMAAPIQSIDEFRQFVKHNLQELPAVAMLAAWHATQKEYEAALKLFQHILQQDEDFDNGLARRSIIKILNLLDDKDPRIAQYRNILRKLSL